MDLLQGGIANGFGGDLNARHRHDYTGLANESSMFPAGTPVPG